MRSLMPGVGQRRKRQSGSAMVEFALCAVLLVTLFDATSEVSMTGPRRNDTNELGHDPGSQFSDQSDDVPQSLDVVLYSTFIGALRAARYPHPLLCGRTGRIDVFRTTRTRVNVVCHPTLLRASAARRRVPARRRRHADRARGHRPQPSPVREQCQR